MTYTERKEKEKHLVYIIERGSLTSLEKIANDYCCSKKTIRRMINDLRNAGYNIKYCRKSYKYFVEK